MERRVFMGLVLVASLIGGGVAMAASVKLSGPEIEALLSGNTITGTWSGTAYRQYYAPDGTTIYVPEGGRADEGRWRTNPDTNDYESWWRSTGWTPYALVRVGEDAYAWINGDRQEPFRVLPGRQIE
ncbi:hypothetical protein ABIE58_003269 [Roseovarius sp. MBR-78]|jgi:hypothetical protein|uniref:hypothetical protein n=1 Tax=Roseovarius sp. MBR-78 TaxID=3156460 RepID=UPI0033926219